MEHQKILLEVLQASKKDPWTQECLQQIQKYEAAYLAIRNSLTEQQQEQLDLYIGACEAWCESHLFVAYRLGKQQTTK